MITFQQITYDVSLGSGEMFLIDGKTTDEKTAVQVVTNLAYDGGVTDIYTIQESNDGINWNNIEWDSVILELPIDAANDTFMLKTYIFYGLYLRGVYTNGTATQGILTITTQTKA